MKYVLTAVVATLALTGTSCLPPVPVSDLTALATASLAEVVEGETVELEAVASNGAPPYLYRWNVELSPSGGQELLSELTSQTVQAGPLPVAGKYVFRLTVTDSEGFMATDYVSIDVVEPDPGDVFEVSIDSPASIPLGESETLEATTSYVGDVSFAWEVITGQGDFDPDNEQTTTVTPTEIGTLVVQVTMFDNDQDRSTDAQVEIDVLEPFTIEVGQPRLASPGEEVSAEVTVEGNPGELTYFWREITGDPVIINATGDNVRIDLTSNLTTHIVVEVTATNEAGSTHTETDDLYISVIEEPNPIIAFEFEEFGTVQVQLDSENAPTTVANFLSYIDEAFYDGLVIHRIEPEESFQVIQGGAFGPEAAPDYPSTDTMPTHDTIINEAEFTTSNIRGTIAMARTPDPNSATSQFFFNMSDNSATLDYGSLPNPDGYAVFGAVLSGMDILDRMVEEVEVVASGGIHSVVNPLVMTSVTRE